MNPRCTFSRLAVASLIIIAGLACDTSPTGPSDPTAETYAASLGINLAAMTKLYPDLYIQDVIVGAGAVATTGKKIDFIYTGYLVDGTQFDSNVAAGGLATPLTLDQNTFITGFALGIPGMRVGGKRKLVVGSSFGYGAAGSLGIPGNATLVFDVQLKSVQ